MPKNHSDSIFRNWTRGKISVRSIVALVGEWLGGKDGHRAKSAKFTPPSGGRLLPWDTAQGIQIFTTQG